MFCRYTSLERGLPGMVVFKYSRPARMRYNVAFVIHEHSKSPPANKLLVNACRQEDTGLISYIGQYMQKPITVSTTFESDTVFYRSWCRTHISICQDEMEFSGFLHCELRHHAVAESEDKGRLWSGKLFRPKFAADGRLPKYFLPRLKRIQRVSLLAMAHKRQWKRPKRKWIRYSSLHWWPAAARCSVRFSSVLRYFGWGTAEGVEVCVAIKVRHPWISRWREKRCAASFGTPDSAADAEVAVCRWPGCCPSRGMSMYRCCSPESMTGTA